MKKLEALLTVACAVWALCWLTFVYAPWLRRSDDRALFVVACAGSAPSLEVVEVCSSIAVRAVP